MKLNKSIAIKLFFIFLFFLTLLLLLKNSSVIFLSIVFCAATMYYKRFVAIDSLGIDFCLTFIMLVSSKYCIIPGMVMSLSYLLGMLISMDITRNPATTTYGTLFYLGVGVIYSFLPINFVFNTIIISIILINIVYMMISLSIGGPINFLVVYTATNALSNILLIRIFGGILRLLF
mgnify:FL=1